MRQSILLAILILNVPTFAIDTTGVYVPSTGQWLLRNVNTAGNPQISFKFGGLAGDLPVAGDWDGNGQTDFAIFRNGTFARARLSTSTPPFSTEPLFPIFFGAPGDLPVAGDWDGDGSDDVGVFRPGPQGTFLLRTAKTFRPCFVCLPQTFVTVRTIILGTAGDVPIAGDWNGDGIDDVGVYQPSSATFVLSEDGAKPTFFFAFGVPGDRPLAGDWTGSGEDRIGVFQPSVPTMVLSPEIPPLTEITFHLGVPSEGRPVAGHWTFP